MLEISRETFSTYLTIKEAAAFLRVSPATLRNWDRVRKLVAPRRPLNGYRLYRPEELMSLLQAVGFRRAPDAGSPSGVASRDRRR